MSLRSHNSYSMLLGIIRVDAVTDDEGAFVFQEEMAIDNMLKNR